jgi:glycosyltransferase involved in cell wall biosynthesis
VDVVLLLRAAHPGYRSIERVFDDIASSLPNDINVSVVSVPRAGGGVLARLQNLYFTRQLRCDVLHVTGDILYCGLASRSPLVLTIHDVGTYRRLTGWRRWALLNRWCRWPARRAAVVTTVSDAVRHELETLVPEVSSKLVVIGNPVGHGFRPDDLDRSVGVYAHVLQVGTAPNKNLERVIVALAGLPVHLTIVGRPSDAQLKLLDEFELRHATVIDVSDSDLVDAYRRSDVVVFVSTYEGFGLPVLEAQACGVPVVTSDLPPMSAVAGDAAVLVDPHDVSAIRAGVLRVLRDPALRDELRARGLENARHATAETIAASYAVVYREAARR